MLAAVFISDLHLHPQMPDIQERFDAFINWALGNTRAIYILGDFFHAWPGDDSLGAWGAGIAAQLHTLVQSGIKIYYLHGNRDFLLGNDFAARAGMQILTDPTVVQLGSQRVLLAHGDQYCTKDRAHQWLRRFTRNRWFPPCFLKLPLKWRLFLTQAVRDHSQRKQTGKKKHHSLTKMDVVVKSMLYDMKKRDVKVLIHGHTHRAREANYKEKGVIYTEFVLSDWDASPKILCYNLTTGIFFKQL